MHVARNPVLCVPSALVRNGSTFLSLPEGQNMVSLSHGTTVNKKQQPRIKDRERLKMLIHEFYIPTPTTRPTPSPATVVPPSLIEAEAG